MAPAVTPAVEGGEPERAELFHTPDTNDDSLLLPTPMARHSGNTPENHLAKKPGRKVVTDLSILVENGLLETGGELPPNGDLLPTPQARDSTGGKPDAADRGRGYNPNLNDLAAAGRLDHPVLPTPMARDHRTASAAEMERHSPNLSSIDALLPTPSCGDANGGGKRNNISLDSTQATDGSGKRGARYLKEVAQLLDAGDDLPVLPTPRRSDSKGTDSPGERSRHTPGLGAIGVYYAAGDDDVDDLMPTPQARDWKGTPGPAHRNGGLNRAVDELVSDVADPPADEPETVVDQSGEQYTLFPAGDEPASLLPTPTVGARRVRNSPGEMARNSPALGAILADLAEKADLLPTPTSSDGSGGGIRTNLSWEGTTRSTGDGGCSRLRDVAGLLGGDNDEGDALLPTPAAADGQRGPDLARANRAGSGGDDLITLAVKTSRTGQWGKYAPAVARWEGLTRPAPSPTEPNKNGNPRLTARFSEWLLGWPEGWVTDPEIGISRSGQLRLIGNGVVPQQAVAALAILLEMLGNEEPDAESETRHVP